ncbi:MAG TPA: vanadium-dependent haloperoxidase, partial [Planctomycetota bacterium]|nr:vanadium-dependent haloperoxidase [Planctomycetota bacterium]
YSLDLTAEAMARVGIAVADAFISCWDLKYFYNLERPITFIQSASGLNDPTWNTAPGIGGGNIPTPPFPEHTSGHSVQSGAAAEVLTDCLGTVAFDDDAHSALGLPARSFSSFHEAADEAAISRLYGGIHYMPAIERGVEQGRCIGNVINTQVQFRK